jgi:hypothetical protein
MRRVGEAQACPPFFVGMRWWARREMRLCPPYDLIFKQQIRLCDLAAHWARGLPLNSRPLQTKGAGNAGRPMRSIAACAKLVVKSTRVSRSHRNHPTFPTQWVTAYLALSSATGLFCHRHPREAFASQERDSRVGESEPHDLAVRFKRARPSHPPRPPQPAPRT